MPKGKNTKRWFRVLLPSVFILIWVGFAAIGGPYMGKISDLADNDLTAFLPSEAESSKVNDQLEKFQNSKSLPVTIVYEKDNKKLTEDDMTAIKEANEELAAVEGVVNEIPPPIRSDDEKAAITIVPLAYDAEFDTVFTALKSEISDAKLPVSATFTGPASFANDLQAGFSGIDSKLLAVTVTFVFLILLVVYRSPFLPIIALSSAVAALGVAVFVVYQLADNGIVQLNAQVQGILFILVIGAATDYALLYIARYREELTDNKSTWKATLAALKSSYPAILAAGGTVTIGLLCLLFSELGSNRALGPVGGIGIAMSVLASLTLLPSLLLVFGRAAFWPRKPKYVHEKEETHFVKNHPAWAKIGALVRLHPRRVWFTCTLLLVVACLGVTQLKADGVPQSSIVLGPSEARDGQKLLDKHFPSGSGSPAFIIAAADKREQVIKALDADSGVASVSIAVTDPDMNSIPAGEAAQEIRDEIRQEVVKERNNQLAEIRDGIEKQMAGLPEQAVDQAYEAIASKVPSVDELTDKAYPFTDTEVKTVDQNVLLQATLTVPADSFDARDSITRLRDTVQKIDSNALVGGTSAAQLDTNVASQKDLRIIVPLILLAITIILMILLRAFVAPIILLVSTVLSFGATMGVAAIVFNNVWNFAGADPTVIIMAFVFLVALGIDYNIFLMTRVREETAKHGVAKGTIKGLVVTGGVITSAGIVLAATFASLSVIPILYLVEIAFIVTFGVLLDTIIVRALLVPAITLEVGRPMWWPSKLSRGKK